MSAPAFTLAVQVFTFLVLFACASQASAQSSLPLSGNVPAQNARHALCSVDNGATPAALTINVSLTTASASGIYIELTDTHSFAVDSANHPDVDSTSAAGSVNATVTTPARSGIQYFMLVILADDLVSAVDYTGSISTSVGTITQVSISPIDYPFVGHASHVRIFNLMLLVDQPITNVPATYRSEIEAFASPAQPVIFRIEWSGDNTSRLRVEDVTSSPPVLLYEFNGPDIVAHVEVLTTPVHLGTVKIRVEQTISSATALNDLWSLHVPSTTLLQKATGQAVPPVTPLANNRRAADCSLGPANETGLGLGLLALFVVLVRGLMRAKAAEPIQVRFRCRGSNHTATLANDHCPARHLRGIPCRSSK